MRYGESVRQLLRTFEKQLVEINFTIHGDNYPGNCQFLNEFADVERERDSERG